MWRTMPAMSAVIRVALITVVVGCEGCRTTGLHQTDAKDAWFNTDNALYWCRANQRESGDPEPTCYRAKFEGGALEIANRYR